MIVHLIDGTYELFRISTVCAASTKATIDPAAL